MDARAMGRMWRRGWLLLLVVFMVPSTALAATTGSYAAEQHTGSQGVGSPLVGVHNQVYGNPQYAYTPGWTGLKCADCHRGDLGAIHSNACDTCHAGTNPRASFIKWNGTCQQGACHPNSTVSTYVSTTTGGAKGVTMTIQAFKHTKLATTSRHTWSGPTANPPLSYMSCATCHKNLQIKTVCFNSGCHGTGTAAKHTPDPTKPSQLLGAHANAPYGSDYATAGTFQGLACTRCHSGGDLSAIHSDRCSICHDGTAAPRKSFTTWNKTCQQGACHPSAQITYNGKQVAVFAHKNLTPATHTEPNGVICGNCHATNLAYQDVCLLCHADNANVRGNHIPSETVGTTLYSPHGGFYGPPNKYAVDLGWSGLKCAECHKGGLMGIHSVTTTCETCHGGANPPRRSFNTWNGTCQQGACHPSIQFTFGGETGTIFKHKNATAAAHKDEGLVCASCHMNLQYKTLCLKCHG